MSNIRRRIAFILCLVCLAVLCDTAASADVRWRNGGASDTPALARAELIESLHQLSRRPHARRVVLRLDGPLDKQDRAALAASGVELLAYLGDHAYFASLSPDLDVDRAISAGRATSVEAIPTARKLHPDLAAGNVRPWAIVGKHLEPDPTVAVYVLFHGDFDLERDATRVIQRHAGWIRSLLETINGAVVHLPASRVESLAAEDGVMYVEPPLPPLKELNDDNRPRVEADLLQQAPYSLNGNGVTVMVYDGGRMFTHGDFAGRLTIGAGDTAGISDHATHVGGTIGGDGAGSGGQFRGMAPAVDIVSYGFEQPGGLQQGFLYTDPGDLEADYTEAITVYGADLSNNSIGTNTASNGFPCEWEGNYGATGVLIDSIARGSLGDPFRIVWANGNERGGLANCGSQYLTTAPPACAKNHITVGALNSNNDSVTGFTSWGPCDDGRMKPDISAPGCQSGGDGGVTSTNSSGGYNVKCGTSMASPTAAGVSALLLQQYRMSFPGEPDFRNSTLKVILAQTAVDIHNTGPDFQTGFGSIRGTPAVDLIVDERFVEDEVAQGEIYTFVVSVGASDPELRVTLAWDDPPGTPNVNPVLVNDLDLRVIGPDDTVYWPWTLDPNNPGNDAVRTQRDGLNNIEQVVIDSPAQGTYVVEVEGFNVAQGPTQTFSAAAAPTLFNCSAAGRLFVSGPEVACESSVNVQVIDCDLDLDDTVIDTTTVTVTSGSEGTGEVITLVETAPASARFEATLPVSTTDAPGVLQVAEGDTVTATYVDADDGLGGTNVPVVGLLGVDCTSPDVLAVTPLEVKAREATLQVDLDEPAGVTLHYGTTCGSPTVSTQAASLSDSHVILVPELNDDTDYYFEVEATDPAGNTVYDDNGGACYAISTPEVPDFFTEQFESGVDLEGFSISFTPNGSSDFYAMCTEPLLIGLPSDPDNGTELNLSDSDTEQVDLLNGAAVLLYGVPYTSVDVSSNGNLTFGAGDPSSGESIDDHFSEPRVSALWDDLDPTEGGTVSWTQFGDRLAITWEDIPEDGTGNANTFQVEMFFDGSIRMSWLRVDLLDAVVGLSAGDGTDPEFIESNLTGGSACGPRPPVVADLSAVTAIDTPVVIDLIAGDDGLPAPPALARRVTRLPAFGTLTDDAAAQSITAVPYELDPAGTSVTYTPDAGVQGVDGFDYVADDGGIAPDGGLSNLGAVAVKIGGVQAPLFEFLVDDTDPGWNAQDQWAFGPPAGTGSHGGDPTSGATGNNVYGFNLNGDYPNNMQFARRLITGSLDLSNRFQTELTFERWLGVQGEFDDVELEIDAGSGWTTLWQNGDEVISDNTWTTQTFDISALADDQPSVKFRWAMGPTDPLLTYPGWNIDDVRILADSSGSCIAAPQEVPNLVPLWDKQRMEWNAAAYAGGFSPDYDVVRSGDATDFSTAVCVEAGDYADTIAVDPDEPLPGAAFFYLIRAANDCGVGSLGKTSLDQERTAPGCPAP